MNAPIQLPQSFLEMPRWWHEGTDWLAALPGAVEAMCQRWNLTLDGQIMHGSNAIVVPVRRDCEPLALRLTFPDARTPDEIRALQFWDGRASTSWPMTRPSAAPSTTSSTKPASIARAQAWVIYRTVDYWFWCLNYGLTEDSLRCARLARVFI